MGLGGQPNRVRPGLGFGAHFIVYQNKSWTEIKYWRPDCNEKFLLPRVSNPIFYCREFQTQLIFAASFKPNWFCREFQKNWYLRLFSFQIDFAAIFKPNFLLQRVSNWGVKFQVFWWLFFHTWFVGWVNGPQWTQFQAKVSLRETFAWKPRFHRQRSHHPPHLE
jgi:hypothetical protein